MIIYYKTETNLVRYLKSIRDVKLYKNGGLLQAFGLKKTQYPDIYFHSGSLNEFSKKLMKNSKVTIVNSTILKNKIIKLLGLDGDKIEVILPAVEVVDFKKKEAQKVFKEQYGIAKEEKIIYFTAKDFSKNGFVKFCNILENLEMTNWRGFVTADSDKETVYAQELLTHKKLIDHVIILDKEIFNIADILVLPTSIENFAYSVLKAMANKCVVFTTTNNNAIEILDVFSIMDGPDDPNLSYKIDMLLRVKSEFKKIKKENYEIASELNYETQYSKLDSILQKLAL